jgi:EPS-associated MarR family transcriptional regulator
MNENKDHFELLRIIQKKPDSTQRQLAKDLGFSLGKLNYCIKSLQLRGLLKLKHFKNNPKKINYLYILTPKGIATKTVITLNFIKMRIKEYKELKRELENK